MWVCDTCRAQNGTSLVGEGKRRCTIKNTNRSGGDDVRTPYASVCDASVVMHQFVMLLISFRFLCLNLQVMDA